MSKSRARYTTAELLEGADALSDLIVSTAWAREGTSFGREIPTSGKSEPSDWLPEDRDPAKGGDK